MAALRLRSVRPGVFKGGATAMPPSSGGSLIQFFLFPLDAVFNKVAPFAV